jgi:PAS domain S-box-containing protein
MDRSYQTASKEQAEGSSVAESQRSFVSDHGPLIEEAHLFRGMFENAVWGMFQTTPEGYYITANRSLARIYGYDSPAELLAEITNIGRQLYVDRNRRDEFTRLMRQNGVVSAFESQVYRRDGTIIWISESCREVRSSSGALLHYEGSVEDITARKGTEIELIAAKEQAEAASRAKSYFLAHMSHELRTPLNAVLGFSQILREEMLGPLGTSRYREYANDIHDSGQHLLDIINDILDLAKIGAGTRRLDEEDINIDDLFADCAQAISESAAQRRIDLKITPPRDPITLRADHARLEAILVNLLSNAVKFTPAGKQVTLSAGSTADGACFLKVTDTGVGMTSDEVIKALQPFQQIADVFTRRHEGAGLGLTLSKAFTELHGGTLVIDSIPGHGTTVTVHLPRWRVISHPLPLAGPLTSPSQGPAVDRDDGPGHIARCG